MYLIFIFVLSVLLFQPVDRNIKGDDDTAFDRFSYIRKLLIIISLALFVIFILLLIRLISIPSLSNLQASIVVGICLLFVFLMLLWMRRMYHNYYVEDRHFFVLNKLFGEKTVNFSEIKEIKYYTSHRSGSGLRIKDFTGKKIYYSGRIL